MIECTPSQFLFEHDEPSIEIRPVSDGHALTMTELRVVARTPNLPLVWRMFGEDRVIPSHVIQDAVRFLEDRDKLVEIGRDCGVRVVPCRFVRQQTVPLDSE